MKKFLVLLSCTALFASCGSPRVVIPRAVNTINTAPLGDLNLQRGDYEILNTITAEASISFTETKKKTQISDQSNEFSLQGTVNKKFGTITYEHQGILRLGYLHSDYVGQNESLTQPEVLARRLAIYRAINIAKEHGADALIEPTIATNIEQIGKNTVIYKTTVTAKIIKLKTNR
ncbi:hypothetical protein [uncultured Rikenella sp.]|uniref:hypothetical protein n=1 Tax=uncultured Rikenella sp. TaxID=368003 RepID=UPI00262BB538|nr:hypothetical protein [uncultured Rikenella sp.]